MMCKKVSFEKKNDIYIYTFFERFNLAIVEALKISEVIILTRNNTVN